MILGCVKLKMLAITYEILLEFVCVSHSACRGQKKAWDSLGLGLQMAVTHVGAMWVIVVKTRSSTRATSLVTSEPSLQPHLLENFQFSWEKFEETGVYTIAYDESIREAWVHEGHLHVLLPTTCFNMGLKTTLRRHWLNLSTRGLPDFRASSSRLLHPSLRICCWHYKAGTANVKALQVWPPLLHVLVKSSPVGSQSISRSGFVQSSLPLVSVASK